MSYWIEVERGALPCGPGVYAVYLDERVVYVGSTTRLEHRCRTYRQQHHWQANYGEPNPHAGLARTPWGFMEWERIRIKVKQSRRLGDWLMWEYRLIRRLRPHYNRAGTNDT